MLRTRLESPSGAILGRHLRPAERLDSIELTSATATLIIVVSAMGFGLIPLFARNLTESGMAPSAVTFFRWSISAVVLLPFLRLSRQKSTPVLWAGCAGVGLGLGWVAYVEALSSAPVSTVAVIYMTYPLFAVLGAWAVFGQRPQRRSALGVGLVSVAAVLALSPAADGAGDLSALAMAFVAPVAFGFTIVILTERLTPLNPLERIWAVSAGAVVGTAPLFFSVSPGEMVPSTPHAWWLILGMAAFTSLLPKIGYSLSARFVGSARTATAGAIELPTMLVVGWLAFGESSGIAELAAGLLVLAAVVLTPPRPPTRDLRTNGRGAVGETPSFSSETPPETSRSCPQTRRVRGDEASQPPDSASHVIVSAGCPRDEHPLAPRRAAGQRRRQPDQTVSQLGMGDRATHRLDHTGGLVTVICRQRRRVGAVHESDVGVTQAGASTLTTTSKGPGSAWSPSSRERGRSISRRSAALTLPILSGCGPGEPRRVITTRRGSCPVLTLRLARLRCHGSCTDIRCTRRIARVTTG